MADRPWQQQTVIAPEAVADDVRLLANRTVAGIPLDPDADGYVPDADVPDVVLGAGVPLIHADDPDDAPARARVWDLRVRDRWADDFAAGVEQYGLAVYVRPDEAETMGEAISDAGYRRRPQ